MAHGLTVITHARLLIRELREIQTQPNSPEISSDHAITRWVGVPDGVFGLTLLKPRTDFRFSKCGMPGHLNVQPESGKNDTERRDAARFSEPCLKRLNARKLRCRRKL